jgi:hypothetical protein
MLKSLTGWTKYTAISPFVDSGSGFDALGFRALQTGYFFGKSVHAETATRLWINGGAFAEITNAPESKGPLSTAKAGDRYSVRCVKASANP